jgi:glycosyltransferase involved in cell wall biosynthesis
LRKLLKERKVINLRRVLFVVNGILNPSGAEFVLLDFLQMQYGIDTFLLILGNNEKTLCLFDKIISREKIKKISNLNFKFNSFTRIASMSYELYKFKKCEQEIRQFIIENSIDVVYANNTIEGMLVNSLDFGIPVICHIHDIIGTFKPAFLKSVKKSLSKANRIIAVSQATEDSMIKEGIVGDKIRVIYNGINVNGKFNMSKYEKCNGKDYIYKIAFVGGCTKRKGVDILVKGLNEFVRSYDKKIELNMVMHAGNSRFEREILSQIDRKIILNRFTNLSREDVMSLYNSMHFVIVPSRRDPLPTVVLESLSEGTPVLGAQSDGIPEIICNEKFLFQSENYKDLSSKLQSLLTMNIEDFNKNMEKQQRYLRSMFSFNNKTSSVLDVISSV